MDAPFSMPEQLWRRSMRKVLPSQSVVRLRSSEANGRPIMRHTIRDAALISILAAQLSSWLPTKMIALS